MLEGSVHYRGSFWSSLKTQILKGKTQMTKSLYKESFSTRHIGPNENDVSEMLKYVQAESLDQLIDQTVPSSIRTQSEMNIPNALSESEALKLLRKRFLLP